MMPTLDYRASLITESERVRLADCETRIEKGMRTVFDVGMALLEIRDSRLYREHYATFEDYVGDKWRIKRQRAYQLMEAAGVSLNLSQICDNGLLEFG